MYPPPPIVSHRLASKENHRVRDVPSRQRNKWPQLMAPETYAQDPRLKERAASHPSNERDTSGHWWTAGIGGQHRKRLLRRPRRVSRHHTAYAKSTARDRLPRRSRWLVGYHVRITFVHGTTTVIKRNLGPSFLVLASLIVWEASDKKLSPKFEAISNARNTRFEEAVIM